MRLFSIALLIAALVPLAAQAQSIKQVEVINLPAVQDVTGTVEVTNDAANPVEIAGEVEVTNLPAASGAARFQLVGFTSETYTGAMGGNFGVTQKCQLEFPNSRMCNEVEVSETTSIPSGLTGDAWGNPLGRFRSQTCDWWTRGEELYNGYRVLANGNPSDRGCALAAPIACCAPVP